MVAGGRPKGPWSLRPLRGLVPRPLRITSMGAPSSPRAKLGVPDFAIRIAEAGNTQLRGERKEARTS